MPLARHVRARSDDVSREIPPVTGRHLHHRVHVCMLTVILAFIGGSAIFRPVQARQGCCVSTVVSLPGPTAGVASPGAHRSNRRSCPHQKPALSGRYGSEIHRGVLTSHGLLKARAGGLSRPGVLTDSASHEASVGRRRKSLHRSLRPGGAPVCASSTTALCARRQGAVSRETRPFPPL